MEKVRIAGIERGDIANSMGKVGYVIWLQGCSIGCKGCHNPDLIPADGGYWERVDNIVRDMEMNKNKWLKDGYVVFLGGEPTDQPVALNELNKEARRMGLKTVLYTGRTQQEFEALGFYVFEFNIIKFGGYDETQRNEGAGLASKNQYYIIDGERVQA